MKFFKLARGRLRVALGFCPLCNSDAPKVYDCYLCGWYQQANGDKYPPTKETKDKWISEYKASLDVWAKIPKIIKAARKIRER
jgi:hypothetical protein